MAPVSRNLRKRQTVSRVVCKETPSRPSRSTELAKTTRRRSLRNERRATCEAREASPPPSLPSCELTQHVHTTTTPTSLEAGHPKVGPAPHRASPDGRGHLAGLQRINSAAIRTSGGLRGGTRLNPAEAESATDPVTSTDDRLLPPLPPPSATTQITPREGAVPAPPFVGNMNQRSGNVDDNSRQAAGRRTSIRRSVRSLSIRQAVPRSRPSEDLAQDALSQEETRRQNVRSEGSNRLPHYSPTTQRAHRKTHRTSISDREARGTDPPFNLTQGTSIPSTTHLVNHRAEEVEENREDIHTPRRNGEGNMSRGERLHVRQYSDIIEKSGDVLEPSSRRTRRRTLPDGERGTMVITSADEDCNVAAGPSLSMTISVAKYNDLKNQLAHYRRMNQELCSSLDLWKERCNEYRASLEKAKVTAEYVSSTPATSASRSSSCALKTPNSKRVASLKSQLFTELSAKEIPFVVTAPFSCFFDEMTTYAHLFTTESCKTQWCKMHSSMSWSPNEVLSEDCTIRDWRGRVLPCPGFQRQEVYKQEDTRFLGVPLLDMVPSPDDDEKVIVRNGYFPVCPHEEATRGTLYTTSAENVSNFIGQSLLSILNASMAEMPSEEMQVTSFALASESAALRKRFHTVCRQVVSARKMSSKEAFFSELGYTFMSTGRGRSVLDLQTHEDERREAYNKLHKIRSDGTRDTAYWRTASFSEICSSRLVHKPVELREVEGADVLFGNEPARSGYKEFRKFSFSENDETTTLSIIRMDAFITSIVDSFASSTAEKDEQNASENRDAPAVMPTRLKRGGKIPLESVQKFRSLMPIAATQLHHRCFLAIKNVIKNSPDRLKAEFGVRDGGRSEGARLGNSQRDLTLAFRYPRNGRFYIALTRDAFRDHVCAWIGNVNDCYVLQSCSLDNSFTIFGRNDAVRVVESDDEIEIGPSSDSARVGKSSFHAANADGDGGELHSDTDDDDLDGALL